MNVNFSNIYSAVGDFLQAEGPQMVGVGCAAYLGGHLVSVFMKAATPEAFGTALFIGYTIAVIAREVFNERNNLKICSILAGVVGGFWLTNRLFYPLTFTELLKTLTVLGIAALMVKYALKQMKSQKVDHNEN